MRNTIKAKVGYEVRHLKSKPDTVRVYDGDNFLSREKCGRMKITLMNS